MVKCWYIRVICLCGAGEGRRTQGNKPASTWIIMGNDDGRKGCCFMIVGGGGCENGTRRGPMMPIADCKPGVRFVKGKLKQGRAARGCRRLKARSNCDRPYFFFFISRCLLVIRRCLFAALRCRGSESDRR